MIFTKIVIMKFCQKYRNLLFMAQKQANFEIFKLRISNIFMYFLSLIRSSSQFQVFFKSHLVAPKSHNDYRCSLERFIFYKINQYSQNKSEISTESYAKNWSRNLKNYVCAGSSAKNAHFGQGVLAASLPPRAPPLEKKSHPIFDAKSLQTSSLNFRKIAKFHSLKSGNSRVFDIFKRWIFH